MNTEEEKIILYVVFAVLFIMSIILISGYAPWLVAGYNTATKKEKEKEIFFKYHKKVSSQSILEGNENIYSLNEISAEEKIRLIKDKEIEPLIIFIDDKSIL